ncbi:MAG: MFS transporter [Lactobacillus sp.]|jgi:predicted MFS family arabinose efflux permease|nr:MFS transporter [Lactobacillus sp.]MCH4068338.1 MFS transporter [Lactobacillus sp.]
MENSSQLGSSQKKHGFLNKVGFQNGKQFSGFLSVVFAGQIIYSAFEAFKGTFYDLLLKVLHLNNAQLGVIFSLIGISVFFYIPGGWINNRFSVRSILIVSMLIRFVTVLAMTLFTLSFGALRVIAVIWGLVDAVFWPAVLNGVDMLSDPGHKGLAYGMLESIRRALEMSMNLILVGVMSLMGGIAVFKGGMFVYNLLLLPLCWWVWKRVPNNGIATEKTNESGKSLEALKGLGKVMTYPKIWLAALVALTIYWCYINLIYTVPYLQAVFHVSQSVASIFGIINTGAMGVLCGAVSGILTDYVFHSTSRMMFSALLLAAITMAILLVMPKGMNMLWQTIILLLIYSFAMFLAKSIIMAPISEADVPDKYTGSAMSVGSFAGYAPVFWAYGLNGSIIDHNKPVTAYTHIFTIGVIVAAAGTVCALILMIANRKQDKKRHEEAMAKREAKKEAEKA